MTDEELESQIPLHYILNLGKIGRREVVEWLRYKELTGVFPSLNLICKVRGGRFEQNFYTTEKMIGVGNEHMDKSKHQDTPYP